MIRNPVVLLAVATVIAAALAWWPWRADLGRGASWLGVLARLVAIGATLLLLLDPGIRLGSTETPLVLLDNSVSMHATGGSADSAAALAASIGDVVPFGELAPSIPGGSSHLTAALASAVAAGRPIVIVTDGEVQDAGAIPPDLLAQAGVRVLPRTTGANVALTDVRMPARLAAGDTLRFEIDVRSTGDIPDTTRITLHDGELHLATLPVVFDSASTVATVRGSLVLPEQLSGNRLIAVRRTGAADAEPQDDLRWRVVRVTPSPGIVVIAETPDWDARTLLSTLAAVSAAPVRGFVQLRPGTWHRMDDLRPVSAEVVRGAAADADLLAVHGDTTAWRGMGRSRILWPTAATAGDWYIYSGGPSPVSGALIGINPDSLPPLPAVSEGLAGDWIGFVARRSRRGPEVPVLVGRSSDGRTIVVGAAGFHAWAMQGGAAEQAWRTILGQGVEWLLAAAPSDESTIRLLDPVVQRGRPVRFEGAGGDQVAVSLGGDSIARADTLRFDGDGIATVALPPGHWRWQTEAGDEGTVVVENYADELWPAPLTLADTEALVVPRPVRRSLLELWPLFAVAVAGFVVEWLIRRRLGLR